MKDSKNKLSWVMKAKPKTFTVRGVGSTSLDVSAPAETAVVRFALERKAGEAITATVVNAQLFAVAYRAFKRPPAVSSDLGNVDDRRLVLEGDGVTRFVPILRDEPVPDDPRVEHPITERCRLPVALIRWVGAAVTHAGAREDLRNVGVAGGLISATDSYRAHRADGADMPSMVIPGVVIPLLPQNAADLLWMTFSRPDARVLFHVDNMGTVVFPEGGLQSAPVVDGDRMSSLPLVTFTVDAEAFRRALKDAGRKTLVDIQVSETMRIDIRADGVPGEIISQTSAPVADFDATDVPDEQVSRFIRVRPRFLHDALSGMEGDVSVTIPKVGPVKLVNGDRCAFIMTIRTSR